MSRQPTEHPAIGRGQTAFAVGTGRCGTKFLYEVVAAEPGVASHHERHPLADSFDRYCRWYRLPVDPAGFLAIKQQGIEADLRQRRFSFESSAYLSLSVKTLHEALGAKIVLLLRRPDKVVNSYARKGWYQQPLVRDDVSLAPGFQPQMQLDHHSFSRVAALGAGAEQWSAMTQVGQLAWYWSQLNRRCLEVLQTLPADAYQVVRLEDLDYRRYLELASFLGIQSVLNEKSFQSIADRKPNQQSDYRGVDQWNAEECEQFQQQVRGLAEQFDYPWKTDQLCAQGTARPAPPRAAGRTPRLQRIRQKIKGALSRLVERI